MDKFNIVILNWNGWEDTRQCIESILVNSTKLNYNIILVDNGSKLDEIELINTYCLEKFKYNIINDKEFFLEQNQVLPEIFSVCPSNEKIIFIKNNENLGFANGNNIALKFLKNIGEKYALLLNNDTEIEDGALNKMFDYLTNDVTNTIGAVIPQIRFFHPKDVIWNCGGSINALGIRRYFYAFKNIKNVPQSGASRVDYGTGCALLMDLSKTDILSSKFFFGEEDLELAFRLKSNGFKIMCLYDAVVYHKVGASRAKISEQRMGNMVFHYSQRMSNLRDHLPYILWLVSFAGHYLSTINLLRSSFLLGRLMECGKIFIGIR